MQERSGELPEDCGRPDSAVNALIFGFIRFISGRVIMPVQTYPIDSILPQLRQEVLTGPSVVLQAPPGAGKTTRVPLSLLDVIPPENGRIIMLEPRRLAATSAARWMAHLLGERVGETVGYSIRFDSRTSAKTRIEVVTEGILTRRMQSDAGLENAAMIIFDEFHERSLHADLALALCLDIQKNLRENLKLMVMSATLDCGPISGLLGNAPVVTSIGRYFPVEERYVADRPEESLTKRITEVVKTALKEIAGDILVFLPGSGEIRSCEDSLKAILKGREDRISVHPLYGDLPFEEQERAILPSQKRRKVVLATNIAETSLTIEGVSVVIDSGLTRRLQYDPSSGMNRLITLKISKASAEQRKGRAGRIGPGVCYRLFSRHVFQSMVPFAPPDILISDLSFLVLELAVWGVKEPSVLRWLDVPPAAAWESAAQLLMDLGALDRTGSVTQAGRDIARLPLHPRLGRLVLRSAELGCAGLGADLAAILSERDMLRGSSSGPATSGKDADIAARLDTLRRWRTGKKTLTGVDVWALRTIERTSGQLLRLISSMRGKSHPEKNGPDLISRLLLSAFPDRIAKRRKEADGRFVLSQGRGMRLPATSSLAKSPFIVAVNLDAGEKAEGTIHMAEPLDEELIRQECRGRIEEVRRFDWDRGEKRITAVSEERLGSLLLSSKPFIPADEESLPLLCGAIKTTPGMLVFSREARQFQARAGLLKRIFPEEEWPDLTEKNLSSRPEEWLLPWLAGMRSAKEVSRMDILPALQAQLSWRQRKLLDERTPTHITAPSGTRIALDYTAGENPVLAVKLQEMFGLADTPTIAGGRVKVLLHLLSPARRPVQVTQDLSGFWNSGYQQVKKELKGRYPKHPWPDDPWNAVPTRRTKRS
jgi:ATP-dependent helicase HrpB